MKWTGNYNTCSSAQWSISWSVARDGRFCSTSQMGTFARLVITYSNAHWLCILLLSPEGVLTKRAVRSGRNWKERYFRLEPTKLAKASASASASADDGGKISFSLFYFKHKSDFKPKGSFLIDHTTTVTERSMVCILRSLPCHMPITCGYKNRIDVYM